MKISKVSLKREKGKKNKLLLLPVLLLSLLLAVSVYLTLPSIKANIFEDIILRTYIKSTGIGGVDREINLINILKDGLRNVWILFRADAPIEKIVIDLKFKEFEKLKNNRIDALKKAKLTL